MEGARDIIFHNLGAQWKGTPSYCDFLRGFFFLLFAGRISEAAMGRTGVGGLNMINMTIRELYYTFADFFQNWNFSIYNLYNINIAESSCRFTVPPTVALLNFKNSGILWRVFCQTRIFAGFSLYIIHRNELRWAGDIIFYRVPRSSYWVRHSSVGCSIAQKGAAFL
jgi:hypothetical protein